MVQRVLILCTGNSARSQMAEALLRALGGDKFEVFSAGTAPKGLHPLAVAAMQTYHLDISQQTSKHLDQFLGQDFDFVITVCDNANDNCPVFSDKTKRLHWSFPDPAAVEGSEEVRLQAFLDVAAALQQQLKTWVASLKV
ncbi:MAG: protein tyrosine phosphatase [Pseudomonadota bacterium]|jgi:arsenate reductase